MQTIHLEYKRLACWAILTLTVFIASACSSLNTTPRVTIDIKESWALLPISNLSETAQADLQAQGMIETQLRSRGIRTVDTYTPVHQVSLRRLLDPNVELIKAKTWAKQSGYRYGLTGSINEWHYRSDADKEPAVGLSLKLLDLFTGEVIWQANSARTGWGYSNLPTVANKIISDLLEEVNIDAASRKIR